MGIEKIVFRRSVDFDGDDPKIFYSKIFIVTEEINGFAVFETDYNALNFEFLAFFLRVDRENAFELAIDRARAFAVEKRVTGKNGKIKGRK